jgi:hypothetical protein
MLHIPRDGRLGDKVNLALMLEIEADYPNARVVIAHLGRAYRARIWSGRSRRYPSQKKYDVRLFRQHL